MTETHSQLKAVSLFSGAGGFDLGIESAGFTTLFATDHDSACCETLRTNKENSKELGKPFLKHASIVKSCVRELDSETILNLISLSPGEVDLLIGGPPCQSFSVIGRRNGRNDPRGELLDDYLRLLAGIRPEAFIFENVKGIKSIEGGSVYAHLVEQMENPAPGLKYTLSLFCLNASDFGVPQNRERVFIIGSKCGQEIKSVSAIAGDTNGDGGEFIKRRTVADAFRGLPEAESDFPRNHNGRQHSKRIADRYANLAPGERDPKTRINKLDPSKPGFTIVSGSSNSGGKGHIHPTEPREVTPRESARLQTFPDWWEFKGKRACDARRQIGNAVPPLLAAVIANQLRVEVFSLPKIGFTEILTILDQTHLNLHNG